MAKHNDTTVWRVSAPPVWPEAPSWMSFSTLSELEACPRRWALGAAEYPHVWERRGYPHAPQSAALEGTVVHLALERITHALTERRYSSSLDESAVSTLKVLGGYTAIIIDCLGRALRPYEGNPRAAPILERTRRRLTARIPEFRSRVQRLLSRIHPESLAVVPSGTTIDREGESRHSLSHGSHTEVELQVPALGWHGIADLLTLSTASCEIRDFKTGTAKQEYEFQLRTYALLWARDCDLNPSGRLADKLVLSYEEGDVEVPTPETNALRSLEDEIRKRTAAALISLRSDPPKAQPNPENCAYCTVRHLCEEYWQCHTPHEVGGESREDQFADLQIKLSARHGPTSWDGIVESSSALRAGRPVLLRTSNLQFDLHPGQRIRLLNVYVSMPKEESAEERLSPVLATMGKNSEVFLVPE